ncbi:MAG: carboxylesterase family protein [Pseudomonadota bacterium]
MKTILRFTLILIVLVVSCFAMLYAYVSPDGKPIAVASDATHVTLESGDLIGYQNNMGAWVWEGVPYAQPPVGDLRWRAPRPVTPWQGQKSALNIGPACASQNNKTAAENNEFNGSEDCLYLNIYAPKNAQERPVMYWIHGGANNGGSSSHPAYDGSNLAAKFNVVVVTINYRLSIFGWLSHPALRANPAIPSDASSNYGTLDQIEGLKWVQKNIAKFGGDANKVTIFGESAGGWNVLALMASPLAKNLFHRAIVQSGGLNIESIETAEHYESDGGHKHSSRQFINQLLIAEGKATDDASARKAQEAMTDDELGVLLREQSTESMFRAFRSDTGGKVFNTLDLIGDGIVLPKVSDSGELFAHPSNYNAVPVMLGTNRDEMKIFLSFSSDHVNTFMKLPIGIKDPQRYDKFNRYASDKWKIDGVDSLAAVMRESQGESVFAYRFDADDLRNFGFLDLKELYGASHGFEIPYVFGNFVTRMSNIVHPAAHHAARDSLSDSMMSYWAAFAHNGNPGIGLDGKQIEWTAWQNTDGANRLMIFDTGLDDGIRMSPEYIELEDLKRRFLADSSFTDQEEYCSAYKLLFTRRAFVQNEYETLGESGCRD